MMTVKQLRAFVAVARSLSFAEACEQVHLSQPALSLAIKKLEDTLGGPLLTRSTRSVALTPEGELLYERGEALLAQWDNVEEELKQRFALQRGKVALAAMPSYAGTDLPLSLRAFTRSYPNIHVEVHDVVAERVIEMVQQGKVEIGIAFESGSAEDLEFTPLFEDDFIAVLPSDHLYADRAEITWAELLTTDFITLQRPSSVRLLMEQKLASAGLSWRLAFEAHQLITVGRMVATGLGVGAVPGLCCQQMEEVGAVCVPLVEPGISRRVGIFTRRRHRLSAAAAGMMDVMLARHATATGYRSEHSGTADK